MPTLDIIMPHYTEPWEIVRPYFDMLRNQKGIDFDEICVRIVHDGTDRFPKQYFEDMPFKVLQYTIKHAGVSAARNYGLDKSTAKWVLFCDCDDLFSSIYSLKFAFDVLDTEDYDLLWNGFYTENVVDEKLILQTNEKFNMVWVHNKYFRREFLEKHKIRFCKDLFFSEDSAFNAVVNLEIDRNRIGEIHSPLPLYIWCWRKDSATTDKRNVIKNIEGLFDRNTYVLNEFRKRDHADADLMAGRTLTDAYVHLTRNDLEGDTGTARRQVVEFIRKEKDVIMRLKREDWEIVMKASVKEAKRNGILNPDRPDFTAWMKEMSRGV